MIRIFFNLKSVVYLSLLLILGQVHFFKDLRPLFHYKCLLIGVC